LGQLIEDLVGSDLPVAIRAYDGTTVGPPAAPATVIVRSPDALARMVQAPGELGFARAYVAGELELEGDIFAALRLRDRLPDVQLSPAQWLDAARLLGRQVFRRLDLPPEEARLHGLRHTKQRDREAVSYHYDLSNDFYQLVLGPSMTYSCAIWTSPSISLEEAQTNKYDLIARKLGLQAGMRLLDVGCGWGGMVMHSVNRYGTGSVGVTLSTKQHDWAEKAIAESGLSGRARVSLRDYRDVDDGPYDAISSIGMFEHVGLVGLRDYFRRLYSLAKPGGRVLNHGISSPPSPGGGRLRVPSPLRLRSGFGRTGFIERYVFPDGELLPVGTVVSAMEEAGFEVRHVESLREHYALTLRAWVANLENNWEAAIDAVGAGRARVWRLYLAAAALNFEAGRTGINQVLAVKPAAGASGLPLRQSF
jgi:cyclopropane-fatty-acyl-phospholipid synthase